MKKYNYGGDWYLPSSDQKFPGRLSIDKKTKLLTLEIFSNRSIEGIGINNFFNHKIQNFHPLILCDCETKLTLYHCSWTRTRKIGKALYQIEYRAEFLFMNVHIFDPNFLIQSASYKFPSLASWYDGWKFNNKIKLDEVIELGIHGGVVDHGSDCILITDNFTLEFYNEFPRQRIQIGIHASLKYQKIVDFIYKKPVSFDELIRDALIFRKLLEFAYGKPLISALTAIKIPKEFILIGENDPFPEENAVSCYVISYELSDGKNVNKNDRFKNNMLLSRWNCEKDELHEIIRKWYINKHLHNVYDYYIDSNNWLQESNAQISNVMFNNKFLNLAQALEDYHRECIKQEMKTDQDFIDKKEQVLDYLKNNPDLQKWLRNNLKAPRYIKYEEKLQAILDRVKPYLLTTITEDHVFKNFPKFVKNKRNELSHGMNKATDQGEIMHVYFHIAQVVLGVCILHSLDILAINIKIKHYIDWNDQQHEIINFEA